MRQGDVMHLPAPLRAVVGLAVTAADEAKHLPDRAIELPMLAVSTALQMSLRAQQRYARLAERGDAVLNRREVRDEPPEWALFDEPVDGGVSRADAADASRLIGDLFGTDRPRLNGVAVEVSDLQADEERAEDELSSAGAERAEDELSSAEHAGAEHAGAEHADAGRAGDGGPSDDRAPATATAAKRPARKKVAKKAAKAAGTTAKPKAAKKIQPARKTPGAAAKKAASGGKSVSRPRTGAPSRFDAVGDD